MANVKVKGLKRVKSNIRKFITRSLRDPVVRKGVGKIVVDNIRAKNFGPPAKTTKKWRERYDGLNATHPTYARNKINITFTGELLNDLQNNVKSKSTGGQFNYIFEQSNKLHKKYNGVSGKIGSRSKYSEISDGIINKWGYDYLKIDDKTLTKVIKFIQTKVEANYVKFNK
jgi:hypothetical protein